MTNSDELITERVVSTANRIEDMDDPDELNPLSVTVQATLDGQARTFTAVLGTGGPHIELNVTEGFVKGWWGTGSHEVPIFDNEELLDELDRRYRRDWEAHITRA